MMLNVFQYQHKNENQHPFASEITHEIVNLRLSHVYLQLVSNENIIINFFLEEY